MLILRVVQTIVLYAGGIFYAVQFAVRTALELVNPVDPGVRSAEKHSLPPAVLSDPSYGQHKFVRVNGINLHYVENGDPAKPLMLFLHGFAEFWYSWRAQLREFSLDHWVVALDLRGHGDSGGSDERSEYRVDRLVGDVRCLVDALGRDKVILVGHDVGAMVGFQFVRKHVDLVDRYVMMGAPSLDVARRLMFTSTRQFGMARDTLLFMIPKVAEYYISDKDFRYLQLEMGQFLTESELEAYKYTLSKKNAVTRSLNFYRENFGSLQQEEELSTVARCVPGLYLWAEHDQFVSSESGPAMVKQYCGLKFRVVPGSGHYMQQESPCLVNKMIRDFLNV